MKPLMSSQAMAECLDRLADEIQSQATEPVTLVGIRRRGVPLAERLATRLEARLGQAPEVGHLDISFHRDDLAQGTAQPRVGVTDIPFSIDDQVVYLVDDVLFTGRTVRSALDALLAIGRPSRVVLVVLVDRGHRELPIQADLVGLSIETEMHDKVVVCLQEVDDRDEVSLEKAGDS